MNILIVGNGFDLAHQLPTTYGNFLDFVSVYEKYNQKLLSGGDIKDLYNNSSELQKDQLLYLSDLKNNDQLTNNYSKRYRNVFFKIYG